MSRSGESYASVVKETQFDAGMDHLVEHIANRLSAVGWDRSAEAFAFIVNLGILGGTSGCSEGAEQLKRHRVFGP
jgi:hypothetical protein